MENSVSFACKKDNFMSFYQFTAFSINLNAQNMNGTTQSIIDLNAHHVNGISTLLILLTTEYLITVQHQ